MTSYQLDQIETQIRNYQDVCNIFFELARDDKMRKQLEEILYEGKIGEFYLASNMSNKDNPFLEGQRRISMSYLLIRNPETFSYLIDNQIGLFHGTNANALPSILKYGMNSVATSVEKGIPVSTGETWSRGPDLRNFISFSDILDIACDYSTIKSTAEDNVLSFGIVFGTTLQDARNAGLCRVSSDTPEIGIRNELPLENIRIICVPSDKIKFVRKIVKKNIMVLPMDDMDKKFYYVEELYGVLIDYDELDALKNNLVEEKSTKNFKIEDIKNLTLGRLLTNIKTKLETFGSILDGEREYDNRKLK